MQEIIKSGNIDDLCPSSVVNELEIRTRGQHENPLWYKVKNRITAFIFHDVLTRKSNTPPQKLVPVERIVGNSESACVDTKVLQWGRKHELIAKKRYKAAAYKILNCKQKGNVHERGVFLCDTAHFLLQVPTVSYHRIEQNIC
jgi:hypothetical protein